MTPELRKKIEDRYSESEVAKRLSDCESFAMIHGFGEYHGKTIQDLICSIVDEILEAKAREIRRLYNGAEMKEIDGRKYTEGFEKALFLAQKIINQQPTMKTLGEMLIGMNVRATKDCCGAEKGKIYVVESDDGYICIGKACGCSATWIPLDFEIRKVEHKHKFTKCECGEEKGV